MLRFRSSVFCQWPSCEAGSAATDTWDQPVTRTVSGGGSDAGAGQSPAGSVGASTPADQSIHSTRSGSDSGFTPGPDTVEMMENLKV
jgi:hypothetical protein